MAKWTKKQTTELIDLYRNYPHLYDVSNSKYRNKIKRDEDLEKIADCLSQGRPDTTVRDIKAKIKTLRTQYAVEKLLLQKSTRDSVYEPKLWCYNQLTFLSHNQRTFSKSFATDSLKIEKYLHYDNDTKDQVLEEELRISPLDIKSRCEIYDVEQPSEIDSEENCVYTSKILTPTKSLKRKHQTERNRNGYDYNEDNPLSTTPPLVKEEESENILKQVRKDINEKSIIDQDDSILFGLSLGKQLQSITDPFARSIAKMKMQEILFKAETGQYSKSTFLSSS